MNPVWKVVAHVTVWVLLGPLALGWVNKVKAWFAGRRGPSVFQLYYDLAKLWHKGVVLSRVVSPGHVLGPAVAWVALLFAALMLPLGSLGGVVSFRGDVVVFLYLLALARFAAGWAGLDAGSAFTGMGVAREVSYSVIAEVALMTALLGLSVQSRSIVLADMLSPSAGPGTLLLGVGLFTVMLAENCRVPFDDPNTHLELTMIHEAMILDHSGPPLAVILHGATVKFMLFAVLVVEAVLPLGEVGMGLSLVVLALATMGMATGVGLVESLAARLAFRQVPLFLTTAFLFCLFALLATWKGAWV